MIDVKRQLDFPSGASRTYWGVAASLNIERRDGRRESLPLVVRIDTPIEAAYFTAGGILPYVLEQLIGQGQEAGDRASVLPS
jgi:aconitase A